MTIQKNDLLSYKIKSRKLTENSTSIPTGSTLNLTKLFFEIWPKILIFAILSNCAHFVETQKYHLVEYGYTNHK